ncbi:MAG: hypothetical protein M3160_01875 [Candidatus Eremiobacteraeota bacterium]|nr:hypothetical protein [Candidatus Eremiobacteraeota bacterium]
MTTGFNWSIVLDVGVGLGVLLLGIGVFIAMRALAGTLARVNLTLDGVDQQLAGIGKPVADTLTHVGGIAGTADQTIARLSRVVDSVEGVAGSVAKTAALTQTAISPTLINVGATLSGISAGLRRLVRGAGGNETTDFK